MGTQRELGSLADGVPRAAQLDPMTACELPEKKMAQGQKVGEGAPNARRTLFRGYCLLGAGKLLEISTLGAGQGGAM